MPEYVCLDGPLRGHVFDWHDDQPAGETVTVGLIGVGSLELEGAPSPRATYWVEVAAGPGTRGALRYLASQGIPRKPALPAALREEIHTSAVGMDGSR